MLYPFNFNISLYLNRFRKKPAITEFDKPFTPNHKLSQSFATDTGTVKLYKNIKYLFIIRSLGFGSNISNLKHRFKICFRYAYSYHLKLATYINSLTHYTKGTLSINLFQLLIMFTISRSFSLLRPNFYIHFFIFPSQYFPLSVI